jgi:membrane associated rhomboid family serine protease
MGCRLTVDTAILTSSPIEIHPSFNPMIGPSPYVLINMGARYQPCMHAMPQIQNATTFVSWPCPNITSLTGPDTNCSLSQLCGLGGVSLPPPGSDMDSQPAPNQWYRFIVPIFLHAGIIHIAFNLLLQLTLGRDIEILIGSVRFAIVYFAAGIWGFVLGGNFAATGIASCGCSGSLFGILAITLLDLLYHWNERRSPVKELLFILLDVVIAFVLGLLPGLDNFSHIGGFLMGLVLGVCILHSPSSVAQRTGSDYYGGVPHKSSRSKSQNATVKTFVKDPLGFFKNRRGVWWAWWLVRGAALVGVLIGFILLLENFYDWPRTTCSWCKYLSCLPVTVDGQNWCEVGNLNITYNNSTTKRAVFDLGMAQLGEMGYY